MYATARETFAHVAKRPLMWLIDDRFITAVAFVTGYDQGLGGQLLKGFGDWLCVRAAKPLHSNLVWWAVVEYLAFPDWFARKRMESDLSPEEDRKLFRFMFDSLDAFLTEKGVDAT
jgi:hypothetical protein